MPEWTVSLERLGKVRDAEIAIAPLTILVGRNNTGKSYVATLIWSLLNSEEIWLRRTSRSFSTDFRTPKWFAEDFCSSEGAEFAEFSHLASSFADWFNGEIEKSKNETFSRVFAWKGVQVDGVKLRFPKGKRLKFRRMVDHDLEDDLPAASFGLNSDDDGQQRIDYSINDTSDAMKSWLFRSIMSASINSRNVLASSREPIYIPAARTGFVLALREIISGLFDNLEANYEGSASSALPLPLVRFLRILSSENSDRLISSAAIADFLESRILSGKVERETGPIPAFNYLPERIDTPIPLRAASSMVTELAPFLQVLRNKDLRPGIIFEEPEAHLHIAAQREMARAIIRLVNSGVPVTITTHSDTFLHQLNLLISSYADPELALKFGYSKEDLLNPDKVRAYEFCQENDITRVREAEKTEFGFIIPSINVVLEDIAKQTLEMQA